MWGCEIKMKKSAGKGRSSCFSIYKQASKTKKQPKTTDAGDWRNNGIFNIRTSCVHNSCTIKTKKYVAAIKDFVVEVYINYT